MRAFLSRTVPPLACLLLPLLPCLPACAPAAAPCPATAATPPPPPTATATSAATTPPSDPDADADVVLLLRPTGTPAPLVHVELTFAKTDPAWTAFRLASGAADHVTRATAHDASGDVPATVADSAPGVLVQLARAPSGGLTLAYDVLPGGDAPDDPLGLLVLEDRFRGAGEKLVALPDAVPDRRANVVVRIDPAPLSAQTAASSFGVGVSRRVQIPPRALRYASFMAGQLGVQVIDDPGVGHDEGAWLGYTTFDPRPTIAELAQIRTALRERLGGSADTPPWAFLLMSQRRPMGSFTTTPRSVSSLLQVGLGEPWSAALRLSMAQQLARFWIGGKLRVATTPGHDAEAWWFSEGVSRYLATVTLAHLGLLSPDEVNEAVGGELSVLATSPFKALGNVELGQQWRDPVARATVMARGALYALRESAAIRAHTKGQRSLVNVLGDLERQVEDHPEKGAIPLAAWLDAVGKDDPDAAKTFDAVIVKGQAPALPGNALGPCFRAGAGEYVAFDPGFDFDATRVSPDGKVVGVRPGGPAAKAGLQNGDVVESMTANEDDADVPVKIVLTRAGGSAKVNVTYVPRGVHGRGQTFTRNRQLPDDRCGELD
jgi:hypothetical protein